MKIEKYCKLSIKKYFQYSLLILFVIAGNLLIFSYSYGMESGQDMVVCPANMHIAYREDGSSPYGSGDYLYSSLKITGSAMPEEEVFNVSELERLYSEEMLGLSAQNKESGSGSIVQGLDLLKFCRMCGLDQRVDAATVFSFYSARSVNPVYSCTLEEIRDTGALIAFSVNGVPLVTEQDSAGYDELHRNDGGPLMLYGGNGVKADHLVKIVISLPDSSEDPYYGLHIREPLLYMQSTAFTVNYIDQGEYKETDDHAQPFRSYTFTMKDVEDLLQEEPEQVRGDYFGITGNEKIKNTLGLGGFSDYYEGIDLCWFLRKKTGLKNGAGKAVFYGRDHDAYAKIDDLKYFFANKNYTEYYLEIDRNTMITDVAPILAVSKNGYPLLPEHDHDLAGHVDYNLFHHNAVSMGFESKIGIVKNVSGPFIAGLPNLDGVYGGYHCETAGDCVRIDLFVNRQDYEKSVTNPYYQDVPADSWFYGDVNELTEQGIVNGMPGSVFNPYDHVTRAQFIKLIAACANAENSDNRTGFTDVPTGHWAASYIGWAFRQGIVDGTGEGLFCPDDPVSREQMAAIMDRYIRKTGRSLFKTVPAPSFSDQQDISVYALDAIRDLSEYAVMRGRENGEFDPHSYATRAEASAVIARLMRLCI